MKATHFVIAKYPLESTLADKGYNFDDLVNAYLKSGYQLHGTTRINKGFYEQNMVLVDKDIEIPSYRHIEKMAREVRAERFSREEKYNDEECAVIDLSDIPF